MAIPVVVVPDGADVTGIGFKKELGNCIDSGRLGAADRARLSVCRLLHWPLTVKDGPA